MKVKEGMFKATTFLLVLTMAAIVVTVIALLWQSGAFKEPTYQQRRVREYRRGVIGEVWFYVKLSLLVIAAASVLVGAVAGMRAIWLASNKAGHVRARGGLYPVITRKQVVWEREPGARFAKPKVETTVMDMNRNPGPALVISQGGKLRYLPIPDLDSAQQALALASLRIQERAAANQDGFDIVDVNVGDGAPAAGGGAPVLTPLDDESIKRLLRDSGLGD
jgi:hypothetical protein